MHNEDNNLHRITILLSLEQILQNFQLPDFELDEDLPHMYHWWFQYWHRPSQPQEFSETEQESGRQEQEMFIEYKRKE